MYSDMAKRTTADLNLIRASFGDSETGMLGAFVPNGVVFIPGGPVAVVPGSVLRWEVHWPNVTFKTPTRAMFNSFIELWQEPGSNDRISRFAERWGPLSIQGDATRVDFAKLERKDSEISVGYDSLAAWKYFSHRAYSVLKLAAEME